MRSYRALVTLVIVVVIAGAARADLDKNLKKGLASMDTHVANLKNFKGNTDRIFERLSEGQRDEVQARLDYVLVQSVMAQKALRAFNDARDKLQKTEGGMLGSGARRKAFTAALEAFEDYRALFDPSVDRCFVDQPEPRYLRVREALDKVPWYRYGERRALREQVEASFFEYAEAYVEATLQAFQPRRDAFYHSLKNLQYSSSGFDLGLQYRFDRAFYGYQALFLAKGEPGYGVPAYAEFPVNTPLAPLLVYRPTHYGRQYSNSLQGQDVTKVLPEAYSDIRELPNEALSREARRIKELQDLVARYERSAQRGDRSALDDAWKAYEQLRDRWDKVGETD